MVKDKQRSHDDLDMGLRVGQEEWPVQTAVYKGAHLGRRTSPDRTIFLTSLFGGRKNMKAHRSHPCSLSRKRRFLPSDPGAHHSTLLKEHLRSP